CCHGYSVMERVYALALEIEREVHLWLWPRRRSGRHGNRPNDFCERSCRGLRNSTTLFASAASRLFVGGDGRPLSSASLAMKRSRFFESELARKSKAPR